MKKNFSVLCLLGASMMVFGAEPIFYESFNKCVNDDYYKGYTGGNDGQWGGDIAKEYVIYTDNNDAENSWNYTNCNGANQCVKVGLNKQNGSITTPEIACSGDITLTFRAAPWISTKEDSVINLSVTGGDIDVSKFIINRNKWNDISVKIYDVESSVRITFASGNKNRFFLDEVKVFPSDPSDAMLRVSPKGFVPFGLFGLGYGNHSQSINVESKNLSAAGVSVQFDDAQSAFVLDKSSFTKTGGKIVVSVKTGMPTGEYSAALTLSGVSAKNGAEKIEKKVYFSYAVAGIVLDGSGTKADPYTVTDVLKLWENDVLFEGDEYWVRGYVLGSAARNSSNQFTGVNKTDELSLVIAGTADESNMSKVLTVQLNAGAARDNLNVVDNAELVGQEIFVYGGLKKYLGVYGVTGVKTEEQYVRDPKVITSIEQTYLEELDLMQPMYDVTGRRVGGDYHGIVIQNGHKWLK